MNRRDFFGVLVSIAGFAIGQCIGKWLAKKIKDVPIVKRYGRKNPMFLDSAKYQWGYEGSFVRRGRDIQGRGFWVKDKHTIIVKREEFFIGTVIHKPLR